MTLIIIGLLAFAVLFTIYFLNQPIFGQAPRGKRLARMEKSPNYKNGKFHNIHFTPTLTEGYSMFGIIYKQLFGKFPDRIPKNAIPFVKTDLKNLDTAGNIMVWFGHSSYFLQLDGKKFLIDPVFSGNASPLPGSVKAFKGSNEYQAEDIPEIDFLLISHDHYDHLDYPTILKLRGKINTIICGLGVGAHFERWGFDVDRIIEKDWNETEILTDSIQIHTTPARHFSGRGLVRNNTLWLSFVLETRNHKLFLGGDSGYDTHFAEIGEKFGPFDMAILENGQYNLAWEAIHLLPEQFVKAAAELNTKRVIPVHYSKFALAQHAWNEPLKEISEYYEKGDFNYTLAIPKIGETVNLDDNHQDFPEWWKS